MLTLKSSYRPDGKGADMLSPTHAYTTANASGQLQGVSAAETLKVSHGPDGKIADVLAWTLASTTAADAPVNYRLMYVPQRLKNFPSPQWETHVLLVACRAAVSSSRVAQ